MLFCHSILRFEVSFFPHLRLRLQTPTQTSEVSRLRQALDVQGAGDVVLYGGLVAPHHGADGFPQAAQVVEDLQGRAHLSGVLEEGRKRQRDKRVKKKQLKAHVAMRL